MERPILKIAVMGSLDHGKSTLIGRLLYSAHTFSKEKIREIRKASGETGKKADLSFFTDQLKEEREGGLTLDSTQALLPGKRRDSVLIDVPGHLEFIKNMISGASQAEAAVLVLDANEGIREQTSRHLFLMDFLGICHFSVIISKMDLIDYDPKRYREVEAKLSVLLKKFSLSPRSVIPVSCFEDVNISKRSGKMPWYKGLCAAEALSDFPSRTKHRAPFRLPVQDIYTIAGKKVAVGRVASGRCAIGEAVSLYPQGLKSRIKKIWVFGENRKKASVMENIGITLSSDGPELRRGDILCGAESPPELRRSLRANFFWMSTTPLKKGQKVNLRCATQETGATVQGISKRMNTSTLEIMEINSDSLLANEACFLDLELEKPIIMEDINSAEELGRFVTEDGNEITGFGMVKKEPLRQNSSDGSPRR